MPLNGRMIVITGGASGIGEATVRRCVDQGARVAVLDRDAERLDRITSELGMPGAVVDVTDQASVRDGVKLALDAMGAVDGLIHAAGISHRDSLADTSLALWQKMIHVNLTGSFIVCRELLPHLIQRGPQVAGGATIVNIGSVSAMLPSLGGAAYSAAKAGVVMLTKSIASEAAPHVRANVVCPGVIDTPMVRNLFTESHDQLQAKLGSIALMQRLGQPHDIAAAAAFLSSGDAAFINGVTLAVDGGRTFH